MYTLNAYGQSRLSRRFLPREFGFLETSMRWALAEGEADTIGEIIDTLCAFGVADSERDDYRRFHNVWAAIDGLRDFAWRGKRAGGPAVHRALRRTLTAAR